MNTLVCDSIVGNPHGFADEHKIVGNFKNPASFKKDENADMDLNGAVADYCPHPDCETETVGTSPGRIVTFVRSEKVPDSERYSKILAIDTECTAVYKDFYDLAVFAWVSAEPDLTYQYGSDVYIKSKKLSKRIDAFVKFDKERLASAPTMEEVFPTIHSVLTQENAVIFAHSADSDITYLCHKMEACGIDRLDFQIYDTCAILKNYCMAKGVVLPGYALGKVCEFWKIPINEHEATSDAGACLGIVHHICNAENISVDQLLELYGAGALSTSTNVYRRMDLKKAKKMVEKISKPTYGRGLGAVARIIIDTGDRKKVFRRGI